MVIKLDKKKYLQAVFSFEFLKFIIIVVFNSGNCILFSLLFSSFFKDNIAFIVGYGISLIISYLLNSIFTFKEDLSIMKLLRFIISYLPNFIIQNIVVFFSMNILHYPKVLTYSFAALIGVPITFLLTKFFAFKE